MSEFHFFFDLIPEAAYKYIVMALLVLLLFRQKIPILNKIDITIQLPEEFMRHFRWITPLLIVGIYFMLIGINITLKKIYENVVLIQQQNSTTQQLVVTRRRGR